MIAEVKDFYSEEIDLETYWPEVEHDFGFWVTAEVGVKNKEGADRFEFLVCSPTWLINEYSDRKIVFGQYMILTLEYDLERVLREIQKYVSTCGGSTWAELASKVSKIGLWEFDNYQE